MAELKTKPDIRYAEFTDAWEQLKLSEISDIRTGPFGSTLHAEDYVEDGTPIITTEHFKTGDLPEQKYGIPQVSDDDFRRLQNYVLKTDDIVFSRVGSVDTNALITPFQSGWLFSGRVLRVRTDMSIDSQYLHFELSTERAKNDVITRAVGQTMPSINTEILKQTKVFIPSEIKEQQNIGKFCSALDDLITLHQREYDKTVNIKKAMLEKMFPNADENKPEIRFAGFTDAWEPHKLGEIVTIKSGWSPSSFKYGDFLFVKVDDLNYSDRVQNESQMMVARKPKCSQVCKGSIIFPKRGAAIMTNKARIMGQNGYMDTNMMALEPVGVDGCFLYLFICRTGLYRIADTSTIPQINNKHIEPYELYLPKLEEQIQIGAFFERYDHLITLHQHELKKLQNMKKALLEKMFV